MTLANADGLRFANWSCRLGRILGLLFFLAVPAGVMGQGVVRYEVTNLTDVVVGEDLWRYDFFLSGFNFQTNQGMSLFFDFGLYTQLAHPAQPGLDPLWDVVVVQPDGLLSADGFLDALSGGDAPSLAVPFRLDFVWLGGVASPAEVPFYTYDSNFQILFAGLTSQVPEPRAWALLSLGLLGWLGRCGRGRRRKQ